MTATQQEGQDELGKSQLVSVRRALAAPPGHVWEVLVSDEGAEALLGKGARLGGKGEPYHTSEGVTGVLRSYHPLEQLRVSWHEDANAPATVVEIDLRADGVGTVLDLTQGHLPDGCDVEALTQRWSHALDALAERVER